MYVLKSRAEVSVIGEWLKKEIEECISNLKGTGFKVRAVITDVHSANFNVFSHLLSTYDWEKKLYIYHSANNRLYKTYLYFDIVRLIKSIRNNNR